MANILSFAEVANITWVHIKMETSKKKAINVHIKDGKNIYFKACAEVLFYTNLDDQIIITNPNNVSLRDYSYLSTLKQALNFYWFWSLRGAESVEIAATSLLAGNIQILRHIYAK